MTVVRLAARSRRGLDARVFKVDSNCQRTKRIGMDPPETINVPGSNYRRGLGNAANERRRGAPGDSGGIATAGGGCHGSTPRPPESVGASPMNKREPGEFRQRTGTAGSVGIPGARRWRRSGDQDQSLFVTTPAFMSGQPWRESSKRVGVERPPGLRRRVRRRAAGRRCWAPESERPGRDRAERSWRPGRRKS